jgi:hypothetical protein
MKGGINCLVGTANALKHRIKLKTNYYYCSARDWERSGLLEENPQSGCSDICYQVKLRYEASQVWMNATFIPLGQQSLV